MVVESHNVSEILGSIIATTKLNFMRIYQPKKVWGLRTQKKKKNVAEKANLNYRWLGK